MRRVGSERAGRPRNRSDRPLTTKERAILTLQLKGCYQREIAERLNLSVTRVTQIVNSNVYITARDKFMQEVDQRFLDLKPKAIQALENGLDSEDKALALRSAETWFKARGYGTYDKNTSPSTLTAEDVVQKLMEAATAPRQINVQINNGVDNGNDPDSRTV